MVTNLQLIKAKCINTDGSYECKCINGYDGDGVQCHDVDECANTRGSPKCGVGGFCINSEGSFICKCSVGYVFKGGDLWTI